MGSVIEWPLTTGTRILTLHGLVMYVAQNVLLLLLHACRSLHLNGFVKLWFLEINLLLL